MHFGKLLQVNTKKIKEDTDSASQLMAAKQDNKIQQEMDSVLETKLKTVNKDISCTNE